MNASRNTCELNMSEYNFRFPVHVLKTLHVCLFVCLFVVQGEDKYNMWSKGKGKGKG